MRGEAIDGFGKTGPAASEKRLSAGDVIVKITDEEVATARVTEIRDRFSVAEVQTLAPGAQVQVRDRVVLK